MIIEPDLDVSVRTEGETATVFAGDYLNKLTGEKIERECKRQLDAGCKELVVDFSDTEIVNSIGVSILLGVIDSAPPPGPGSSFRTLTKTPSSFSKCSA